MTTIFGGTELDSNLESIGITTSIDGIILSGSTATIDATDLKIEDVVIELASGNISDTLTTGVYSSYTDGTVKSAGLLRSAIDKSYYLVKDGPPVVSGSTNPIPLPRADLNVNNVNLANLTMSGNTTHTGTNLTDIVANNTNALTIKQGANPFLTMDTVANRVVINKPAVVESGLTISGNTTHNTASNVDIVDLDSNSYVVAQGLNTFIKCSTESLNNKIVLAKPVDIIDRFSLSGNAYFDSDFVPFRFDKNLKPIASLDTDGLTLYDEQPIQGSIRLQPHAATTNHTMVLPPDVGLPGDYLQSDALGNTFWNNPLTGNEIVQDGNLLNTNMVVGTNDDFDVSIIRNNVEKVRISDLTTMIEGRDIVEDGKSLDIINSNLVLNVSLDAPPILRSTADLGNVNKHVVVDEPNSLIFVANGAGVASYSYDEAKVLTGIVNLTLPGTNNNYISVDVDSSRLILSGGGDLHLVAYNIITGLMTLVNTNNTYGAYLDASFDPWNGSKVWSPCGTQGVKLFNIIADVLVEVPFVVAGNAKSLVKLPNHLIYGTTNGIQIVSTVVESNPINTYSNVSLTQVNGLSYTNSGLLWVMRNTSILDLYDAGTPGTISFLATISLGANGDKVFARADNSSQQFRDLVYLAEATQGFRIYEWVSPNIVLLAGGPYKPNAASVQGITVTSDNTIIVGNSGAGVVSYVSESCISMKCITATGVEDAPTALTGSLRTLGGASVGKSLFVGDNIKLGLDLQINNTSIRNHPDDPTLLITLPAFQGSTESGLINDGFGGLSYQKVVLNGGNLPSSTLVMGTNNFWNMSLKTNNVERVAIGDTTTSIKNQFNVADTTESTVVGVGSTIIAGGVSVAKNINIGGNTTITGDLVVNGTTTTLNSTTVSIADPIIDLSVGNTADISNTGITTTYNDGVEKYASILRLPGNLGWEFLKDATVKPSPSSIGVGSVLDRISCDRVTTQFGSQALPSYSYWGESNTGMYHSNTNEIGFAIAGTSTPLKINALGIESTVKYVAPDGSVASPSISFVNEPSTGIRRSAANSIAFSSNNTTPLIVSDTVITSNVHHRGVDGSAGSPSYGFQNNNGLGLARNGNNSMVFYANSSNKMEVNAFGVECNSSLFLSNGSQTAPSISFNSDRDTGFYTASPYGVIKASCNNTQVMTLSATNMLLEKPLQLKNGSGIVTLQAPTAGVYTLTLPTSDGNLNDVLSTNGSGVLTWVPPALPTITEGVNVQNPTYPKGHLRVGNVVIKYGLWHTNVLNPFPVSIGTDNGPAFNQVLYGAATALNTVPRIAVVYSLTVGSIAVNTFNASGAEAGTPFYYIVIGTTA